jgi:hypothetical protein
LRFAIEFKPQIANRQLQMAWFDQSNFVHSLALWMEAQLLALDPAFTLKVGDQQLQVSYQTIPRSLWIYQAKEMVFSTVDGVTDGVTVATDPHATLRTYPGRPRTWGKKTNGVSLQVEVLASNDSDGSRFAAALAYCFTDGKENPLRMQIIPGYILDPADAKGADDGKYMIVGAMPLQEPGLIGRDDGKKGKGLIVFNVDMDVRRPTDDELSRAA